MQSFRRAFPHLCAMLFRGAFLPASVALFSPQSALGEFKVGLVLDRGGKDDNSFNSSAYQGASQAKSKLGIYLQFVEAADDNAFEPLLQSFARRDFDLMIGIGFAQKEAIKKVASQFPLPYVRRTPGRLPRRRHRRPDQQDRQNRFRGRHGHSPDSPFPDGL